MQQIWQWPAVVALFVASIFTLAEFVTTKYPRTFFIIRRTRSLMLLFASYALIYGGIAFFVWLGLDSLLARDEIAVEGTWVDNPWLQAVAIGMSAKAFMHIRLFSIRAGGKPFPVGVETLVHLFEPELTRQIDLLHYSAVRSYIADKAGDRGSGTVKQAILENVPGSIEDNERAAFIEDVKAAKSVVELLEMYLTFAGKSNFERVFDRP